MYRRSEYISRSEYLCIYRSLTFALCHLKLPWQRHKSPEMAPLSPLILLHSEHLLFVARCYVMITKNPQSIGSGSIKLFCECLVRNHAWKYVKRLAAPQYWCHFVRLGVLYDQQIFDHNPSNSHWVTTGTVRELWTSICPAVSENINIS